MNESEMKFEHLTELMAVVNLVKADAIGCFDDYMTDRQAIGFLRAAARQRFAEFARLRDEMQAWKDFSRFAAPE